MLVSTAGFCSCVEEASSPVVFDQVIESVHFQNLLFSPVVLYRNGVPFDTLLSRDSTTYRIDDKGAFRHEWKLISPTNNLGDKIGIEGRTDLGLQYEVNGSYRISNVLNGQTIFTPRILNLTAKTIQWLWVNFQGTNQVRVARSVPGNSITSLEHAPYFVWTNNANVVIEDPNRIRLFHFSRNDTTKDGDAELRFSTDLEFGGSGLTEPLEIR